MDHPSHPVVPCLVLLLYLFAAFAYNGINHLFSVSTLHTLAILLRAISFRLEIIGSHSAGMAKFTNWHVYLFLLITIQSSYYYFTSFVLILEKIQFLSLDLPFLAISCAIAPVYCLKYPYSCFSSHLCFLNCCFTSFIYVVIAITGRCNKSFFVLFFVYSSNPWIVVSIQSLLQTNPLLPSFLAT